jgi:hypothetical protein
MSLIRCSSLACVLVLFATTAYAQGTNVGVTVAGLASFQPTDDYVGGLISRGLGGVGPGVAGGVTVAGPGAFVVAAEFSTAWLTVEQSQRSIFGSEPAVLHLHDAMVSGLIGFNSRRGKTQAHSLFGVAVMVSDRFRSRWPLAPTGGIDIVHQVSPRASVVGGGRYTYVPRTDRGRFAGIGPHIIRIAAGLRVRLTD